jgi:rfaE bifunctional protein nucleotidyltransferase chain/domain
VDKLQILKNKIFSLDDLLRNALVWRFRGDKIVFTNGCFDIIHRGHIEYLAQAASLGNRLIIGVNTDSSVSTLKGPNRPVNDEQTRAEILAAFSFVDAVVLFSEETPINLITSIKPDILVKGGDYNPDTIVGANVVKDNGGRVEVIPFVNGFSTSSIINKILAKG